MKIKYHKLLCFILAGALGLMSGLFLLTDGLRMIDFFEQNISVSDEVQLKLDLKSTTGYHYTDSILNVKTGELIPVRYERADTAWFLYNVKEAPLWIRAIGCLIGLAGIIFYGLTLRWLGVFMKNIREGDVFIGKNVGLLRKAGMMLLFLFISVALFRYIDNWCITQQISFEYYQIKANWLQPVYLVAALFCLLGAEIFSVGLRMKEEQDLTI